MFIVHNHNSCNVLLFIATEGYVSTDTGDPYLYFVSDTYYSSSVLTVVYLYILEKYFNGYNTI